MSLDFIKVSEKIFHILVMLILIGMSITLIKIYHEIFTFFRQSYKVGVISI
jgi:hypothetical protein